MPSHRALRVAEMIREFVSTAILFEVSDPRVSNVTVLRAEVTGDLRTATVYVSVLGNETHRKLCMRGLESATGFLQKRVAQQLQIRFAPILCFKLDDSLQKTIEINKIIDDAMSSSRPTNVVSQVNDGDDNDDDDDDDQSDDAELSHRENSRTEQPLPDAVGVGLGSHSDANHQD